MAGPAPGGSPVHQAARWRSTATCCSRPAATSTRRCAGWSTSASSTGSSTNASASPTSRRCSSRPARSSARRRASRSRPKGEKRIRQDSLNEIFSTLKAGGPGDHRTPIAGKGGERLSETRAYRFGDNLSDLDPLGSVGNAVMNHGIDELIAHRGRPRGVRAPSTCRACATVLMVDISHSMILYGEDRITPAKKIALALTQLIQTRYPQATRWTWCCSATTRRSVPLRDLMKIQAGPVPHQHARRAPAGAADARPRARASTSRSS